MKLANSLLSLNVMSSDLLSLTEPLKEYIENAVVRNSYKKTEIDKFKEQNKFWLDYLRYFYEISGYGHGYENFLVFIENKYFKK